MWVFSILSENNSRQLNDPKASSKHRLPPPTPVSDSVGLGWAQEFTSAASSLLLLVVLARPIL